MDFKEFVIDLAKLDFDKELQLCFIATKIGKLAEEVQTYDDINDEHELSNYYIESKIEFIEGLNQIFYFVYYDVSLKELEVLLDS